MRGKLSFFFSSGSGWELLSAITKVRGEPEAATDPPQEAESGATSLKKRLLGRSINQMGELYPLSLSLTQAPSGNYTQPPSGNSLPAE